MDPRAEKGRRSGPNDGPGLRYGTWTAMSGGRYPGRPALLDTAGRSGPSGDTYVSCTSLRRAVVRPPLELCPVVLQM